MMRRGVAVLGLVGLAMVGGVAPASAVPAVSSAGGALVCHANGDGTYSPFYVRPHGMTMNWAGHGDHPGDIMPAFADADHPNGRNMTPENMALRNNGCVAPATAPAAAKPKTRNTGYNVDGAVQGQPADVGPGWLAAAGLVPVAAFVFWRNRVRSRDVVR